MKKSGIGKSTNISDEFKPESLTTKTKNLEECGSECPICHGSGWELYVGDDGNEYARECQCGIRKKQIQENRLSFASIPVNYQNVALTDMRTSYYSKQDSKDVFKATMGLVKWYLEHLDENMKSGKGIYFWSETKGSGKTMLTTALANELIHKHHKTAKFATSLDILGEIRATYDKDSGTSESKLLRDLVSTDFLVIDDFGTERATDWAGEKFYQIVNSRYINNKVTFYTSNWNLKTLKYDDRITNRVREKSYLVHFPEESIREYKARTENRSIE
jgi:DNA replication protein DnaC